MMLLHLFGTMSLWLRLLARRNPLETFKLMGPVLVTAFSTSSSAATLPTALASRARTSACARPSPASCCRSAPP